MLPGIMAVTLQDIAQDLKVSVITVSKVLRNTGKISPATRKRVLRRAEELNYRTNRIARSLVTRRTFTIGLLLPDFTHPFFAEVAKTIAATVRPDGYHLIISYFEENSALERSETESLLDRQVDGLIIASAHPTSKTGSFGELRRSKVPFVLIDRPVRGAAASFVGADNTAIGKLATAHLIKQGCCRIAHLRGPGTGIAAARLEGYRQALAAHGLVPDYRNIVEAGYEDTTGFQAMQSLLGKEPVPDGVCCYNDPVAIGALKAIFESGRNVPRDIAVIGAGNVHYSEMLTVPLSTVDQGTVQIGKQAAELLLKQIVSKHRIAPQTILLAPKLVVRESTLRGKTSRAE
jgi:LacI family transcriptional regulator